ncbi:MAG: hypothetical protein SO135_04705 [Sphaerochaetaceae bacterium]|jgi:hypothetical protein|nr:hypothetical protein [Sphaerochaetaceae bacterium]NLY07072.1 hypothetical protein [Spirochaetales bacterium]
MEVNELIKNSPIRVFEKSINGGLGKGNIGVLASRHGIGKTACLVHIATDKLFKGEHVVHVSFSGNVEHVLNWYKEVFREISEYKSLDDAFSVYETMRENRVVMNFSQKNISVDKIISSLTTLIQQGSFQADTVLFDGYQLTKATPEDVKKIKAFAQAMNIEVWFSVSPALTDVAFDEYGVPETMKPYLDLIDVLLGLKYNEEKSKVIMTVVQDHHKSPSHFTGVTLDPRTMLITE